MRYLTPIAPVFVLATGLLVATPNPSQSSPGPCSQADPVCVNREAAIGGNSVTPRPQHTQNNVYIPGQGLIQNYTAPLGSGSSSSTTHWPDGSVTICQGGPGMTTICH